MDCGHISNQQRRNASSNYGSNNNGSGTLPNQQARREQDLYLPIANVTRIMRRILPQHAKVSDDAKEAVQELVSQFINHITIIANERCHKEQRRTVTAEDCIWAMNKIGLTNYVEPLTLYLQRYREQESDRSSGQRRPVHMSPNVELGLAPPTGSVQAFPLNYAPAQGYPYPQFHSFYDPAVMMNGFNMNYGNEGMAENDEPAESSSSTGTNYGLPGVNDPFGQFRK